MRLTGRGFQTALPALGDPIIGVDVSADGRWIVATCKTYLLLIDTLIGDGRYAGSLGFDRSFPADSKPIPRRLQLKPEHLAYMATEISFTPARFNTGEGQVEKNIVTSSGPFVITCKSCSLRYSRCRRTKTHRVPPFTIGDFKRVKQGKLDEYSIKKYQSNVVADEFKYGSDKNVVVALEHNVLMVNKKDLLKVTTGWVLVAVYIEADFSVFLFSQPTRASLSTPMKKLRSQNNIVNSPY